ncbi:hypothetical protein ACFSNO_32115, partial [Streptomyces cirratus]
MPTHAAYRRCTRKGPKREHMPYRNLNLRKRCETILGHLDLSRPFSLENLCTDIAEQRGRP